MALECLAAGIMSCPHLIRGSLVKKTLLLEGSANFRRGLALFILYTDKTITQDI